MQKNKCLLMAIFIMLTHFSFSQNTDSTKSISHISGVISVTHNGISLIPTFSLGKPATIINLSFGGPRLSFDPDIRFSLQGKPWSFLFWMRYKAVNKGKFRLTVGAHPAYNFKTSYLPVNGNTTETIVTRRFLAGELSPNYILSKKVSIGMYYLYSRSFDYGVAKNTHFLTLNSNISDIGITNKFYLKLSPSFII